MCFLQYVSLYVYLKPIFVYTKSIFERKIFMSNYHREQDAINDEKIQGFKSEFPKYIGDFLDNMRELNNSSKTRLGYVYDLRTFFAFL